MALDITVPAGVDLDEVARRLRRAGARFALVFGSRVTGTPRPDSDLDVGAWWGEEAPGAWTVDLPDGVDLVVLDDAPLVLAGRVALEGRLLVDDDPASRVRWQADVRKRYLDEAPRRARADADFSAAVRGG